MRIGKIIMDITHADGDVRYVPGEWAANGFCAIAHETRYLWLLDKFNLRNKRILDFGCGAGYGANIIADVAQSIVAVDISCEAISYARKNYIKQNLKFINGDISSIDFPHKINTKFDLIVSFDVIEHVERYYDFVTNIKSLLNIGGIAIIGCPNRWATFDFNVGWNLYHMQEFTPAQLYWLMSTRFNNVEIYSQDFIDKNIHSAFTVKNNKQNVSAFYLIKELIKKLLPKAYHVFFRNIKRTIDNKDMPSKGGFNLKNSDISFQKIALDDQLKCKKPFGIIAVCKNF